MRRIVVASLGGVLFLVSLATGSALVAPTVASAAASSCKPAYPPSKATITLSTSTVSPGGTVTVSGTSFVPASQLTIGLSPGGEQLGTTTVGANGSFSTTVTIPSSLAPGSYSITVNGTGCNGKAIALSSAITVTAGVTTTTTPGLPFTGSNVALPVGLGLALLGIGLFAVIYSRRRPRTAGRG